MNIWNRLRNLWKLSEWEPSNRQFEKNSEIGRSFAPLTKEPLRKAQIIKKTTPAQDFLNEK